MKKFENLSPALKNLIQKSCQNSDEFSSKTPEVLYINIANSLRSFDIKKAAEIFNVSTVLCYMIKQELEEN